MPTPSTIPRPEQRHAPVDTDIKIPENVPEFLRATRPPTRRRVTAGLVLAVLTVAAIVALAVQWQPESGAEISVHDGWSVHVPEATWSTADSAVVDGWAVNVPETDSRVHDGWTVTIPEADSGVHDGWAVTVPGD